MRITQKIAFLVLTLALFSGGIRNFSIYIDFYVNQDYIAAELCENKAKPEMKCNGQCHLMKQLQEVENVDPESPVIPVTNYEVSLLFFSEVGSVGPFSEETQEAQLLLPSFRGQLSSGHTHPQFSPPDLMI